MLRRVNKIQRRKITIFIRCVIISFVAWALFAISSSYTFFIRTGIEYVNLPESKAFHPLQADSILVSMKMTGWKILATRLQGDSSRVKVDLSNLKNNNFIVFSDQIAYLNRQFSSDREVIGVTPDTLFFDFSKQTQRKVPIKPMLSLNFKKQYGIIGDTRTNPDYVTITGPLEDVANIEYIETDTIRGNDLEMDVRSFTYLNRQHKTNITVYPSYAEVTIPIGEMTEKVLEVPLKIENADKYTSVRTLPSKVTITLLLAMKDYGKWTSSDFEAVVDLESWERDKIASLPVILTKKPDFCEVLNIYPQNVDFFVRP